MSQHSLNDRAVVLLIAMQEANALAEGHRDFGEPTGFADEQEQLNADAMQAMGSLRARALKLSTRIKAHQKAKEPVV